MAGDQCSSSGKDSPVITAKGRDDQAPCRHSLQQMSLPAHTDPSSGFGKKLGAESTGNNDPRSVTQIHRGEEEHTCVMSKEDRPKVAEGQELLPNGIPKIVFDLTTTPLFNKSSSTSSSTGDMGVALDSADCHLDLEIDNSNPLVAKCMHTDGFQYMWKGVRATKGAKHKGKFFFEVKLLECPAVVMPDTPSATRNVCRVGVSEPLTSLHLGDSPESWGFGGTGKKSNDKKYFDYGVPFGKNDVVGVVIDLDALKLSYTKNGQFLGIAFELPPRVRDTGLFPHIYVKNVDFEVNFKEATKWFAAPGTGLTFLGDADSTSLLDNPVEHPSNVSKCEFLMMCGLPGCGKTYWAERYMEKNAAKSYVLLGTNAIIDQMKVMGLKRHANYAARWEELMSTASVVFNKLLAHAGSGKVVRNIIIDQTNVFKMARRRKVEPFASWGVRRCIVMVTDERTLQQRTQKREMEEGKMVPLSAVMDMKAAFVLPVKEDGFTSVEYVEMPEVESRREIRRINDEGKMYKRNNPDVRGREPKPCIETRPLEIREDFVPVKKQRVEGGERRWECGATALDGSNRSHNWGVGQGAWQQYGQGARSYYSNHGGNGSNWCNHQQPCGAARGYMGHHNQGPYVRHHSGFQATNSQQWGMFRPPEQWGNQGPDGGNPGAYFQYGCGSGGRNYSSR